MILIEKKLSDIANVYILNNDHKLSNTTFVYQYKINDSNGNQTNPCTTITQHIKVWKIDLILNKNY